ncbi:MULTISPECIES: ABC transporter substrate-binding protein [unclassified Brachybacterium]|uniref:ABC transporter substrate-binding protein n=1 Tax=unclassified Brachybacterium TaxID=2623841 RepID=UPI00361D5375
MSTRTAHALPSVGRRAVLGGALTLPAVGLSSCGSGVGATGATGAMSLLTYDDVSEAGLMQEQLNAFEESGGTRFSLDTVPGSGAAQFPDKLRTRILGGNAPDVWRIWGGMIGGPFVDAGLVLNLDEYYEQYGWEQIFSEPGVEGMTFASHRHGVPLKISSIGAWCNATILEDAGAAIPTTYDELEQLNDAVLDIGVTPAGMGGKYGWHIMRLFEYLLEVTAGPQLHDALLLAEESWDRPEVVEAFDLFRTWADREWIAPGALGIDPADAEMTFVQGTAAYTLSGPWIEASNIVPSGQPPENFTTFLLPTDHDVVRHSGFVEGFMISETSSRPDEAAEMLDFLMQADVQRALQNTSSATLAAPPDEDEFPLSAQWSRIRTESPIYTIQDQALPKAQSDSYYAVQSGVLQGSTSPPDAAREMEQVLTDWRNSR